MVQIVSMEGLSKKERSAEQRRWKAHRLATVAAAPGWQEFRELCFHNAELLERTVLDAGQYPDVRAMDRAIGKAAAYRQIPELVEQATRSYMRAAEKAAAERASQAQEQQR